MFERNKGLSIVEIVIVAVFVLIVGLIGWKVWTTMNAPKAAAPIAPAQQEVNSQEDLDKVDKALDETDIEGDETRELDSQISF